MADDSDTPPDYPVDSEENGGGPIKTFLEHLEDLRWTLIKCVLAIAVGFIVCMSGAPWIIRFLTWPLERSERIRTTSDPRVVFVWGTNVLTKVPSKDAGIVGLSTNRDTILRIAPVLVGTNLMLQLQTETNPPPAALMGNKVDLKVLGPVAAFNIVMQIAIYGGITVAAPLILLFIGQFVLPAMHVHEKRFLYKAAGIAAGLFVLGVAFCYLLLLVICLSTTVSFSQWLGFSADMWRAEEYISFCTLFMLGMGVSFQLPLVLLTLVKIGVLDSKKLGKFRSYWVVAGLAMSALITPDGNPINMLLLFVPLHLLYEISVVIAWFWARKDARIEAAKAAAEREANRQQLARQREQAEKGSPVAQFYLGLRFLEGDEVDRNEKLGRQWIEKAAAQGHEDAIQKLKDLDEAAAEAFADKASNGGTEEPS